MSSVTDALTALTATMAVAPATLRGHGVSASGYYNNNQFDWKSAVEHDGGV